MNIGYIKNRMAFNDFLKYAEAQGKSITVPEAGDIFELGNSTVKVLGPVRSYSEANNQSLILKIEYGKTSFLFTGDLERDAEQDLLEEWDESELEATVLKVGHHGSENSTSYTFLMGGFLPQKTGNVLSLFGKRIIIKPL